MPSVIYIHRGHGIIVTAGLFMLIEHDIKRINTGGTLCVVERLLRKISRIVLKTDQLSRNTTFIIMGH